MATPYVIPEQLDKARAFWLDVAQKNSWAGPLHTFYVQVWVDSVGNVVDSVSFEGMTEDHVVLMDDDEPCRECGEDASDGDRPMKGDNLCWGCYREMYEEEED